MFARFFSRLFGRPSIKYAVCFDGPLFHFWAEHAIFYEDENGNLTAETIHGHDFIASLRIDGPLDSASRVADFVPLKDAFLDVLDDWDKALVLPKGYELPPNSSHQSKKKRYVKAKNPTNEVVAGLILQEVVKRLVKKGVVSKNLLDQFSFTLRLVVKLEGYAEATMGK